MDWIKWFLALVGHIGFWCVVFNRVHATAWPRPSRKLSEKAIILGVILPIGWVVSRLVGQRSLAMQSLGQYALVYVYGCVLLGVFFIVCWLWRRFWVRLPVPVIESNIAWIDVQQQVGKPLFHGAIAKALGLIPFNEERTS